MTYLFTKLAQLLLLRMSDKNFEKGKPRRKQGTQSYWSTEAGYRFQDGRTAGSTTPTATENHSVFFRPRTTYRKCLVSAIQTEAISQQTNKMLAQFIGALDVGLQELLTQHRLRTKLLDKYRANIEDLLLATLRESPANTENTRGQPWGWNPGIESPDISVGTLTVLKGNDIPLHDHPDSTGLLLVLNGSVQIKSFRIFGSPGAREQQPMELELTDEVLLEVGEYGHFGPGTNNIHSLHAIDSDCRLYDVLFSPYTLHQRSFFMPIVPENGSNNIFVTRLNKLRNKSAH